jgi:hypothetical protein
VRQEYGPDAVAQLQRLGATTVPRRRRGRSCARTSAHRVSRSARPTSSPACASSTTSWSRTRPSPSS